MDSPLVCAFGSPWLDHFAPPIGTGIGCARCQLPRMRAQTFVAEFLIWWHHAGVNFYGRNRRLADEGLRDFARDAVRALGGWRFGCAVLRAQRQKAIA